MGSETRQRTGRPPKLPADRRVHQLTVAATTAEVERWQAEAHDAGFDQIAPFIRARLNKAPAATVASA